MAVTVMYLGRSKRSTQIFLRQRSRLASYRKNWTLGDSGDASDSWENGDDGAYSTASKLAGTAGIQLTTPIEAHRATDDTRQRASQQPIRLFPTFCMESLPGCYHHIAHRQVFTPSSDRVACCSW